MLQEEPAALVLLRDDVLVSNAAAINSASMPSRIKKEKFVKP
jgi:hypothetical protein